MLARSYVIKHIAKPSGSGYFYPVKADYVGFIRTAGLMRSYTTRIASDGSSLGRTSYEHIVELRDKGSCSRYTVKTYLNIATDIVCERNLDIGPAAIVRFYIISVRNHDKIRSSGFGYFRYTDNETRASFISALDTESKDIVAPYGKTRSYKPVVVRYAGCGLDKTGILHPGSGCQRRILYGIPHRIYSHRIDYLSIVQDASVRIQSLQISRRNTVAVDSRPRSEIYGKCVIIFKTILKYCFFSIPAQCNGIDRGIYIVVDRA